MMEVGRRVSSPTLITIVAFLVLVARRPETLLDAEFYADDSALYTEAFSGGFGRLLDPHGGTILLSQRVLTLPQLWVSPYWAPLVANVLALTVAALVAGFLASSRFDEILPQPSRRVVLALGFVLLPGSYELFGTMSHLQWIGGAWLIAIAVAKPGPRYEIAIVAAAALTGPQAVFVLPVFAVRWFLRRDNLPILLTVIACACVQLLVLVFLDGSRRPPPMTPDISIVPAVMITRVLHASLPYAVGLLGLVVIATIDVRREYLLIATLVSVSIPLAGLLGTPAPTIQFFDEVSAARYFWLSTALIAGGVFAARSRRASSRAARRLALAGFAIMFAFSARLQPFPIAGWASASACIGGIERCVIPVGPSQYWWIVWPGSSNGQTSPTPHILGAEP